MPPYATVAKLFFLLKKLPVLLFPSILFGIVAVGIHLRGYRLLHYRTKFLSIELWIRDIQNNGRFFFFEKIHTSGNQDVRRC